VGTNLLRGDDGLYRCANEPHEVGINDVCDGGLGTDSANADCEHVRRVENPGAAAGVQSELPEGLKEH
jgi:hypothetical protein